MKCIQYWPENRETQQFATLNVSHEETLEFEDHIERVFWLKHKRVRKQMNMKKNSSFMFHLHTIIVNTIMYALQTYMKFISKLHTVWKSVLLA